MEENRKNQEGSMACRCFPTASQEPNSPRNIPEPSKIAVVSRSSPPSENWLLYRKDSLLTGSLSSPSSMPTRTQASTAPMNGIEEGPANEGIGGTDKLGDHDLVAAAEDGQTDGITDDQ